MSVANDSRLGQPLGDMTICPSRTLPDDGLSLLKRAGLNDSDIGADDALRFFVCRRRDGVAAAVFGLSIKQDQAYLRSLVVDSDCRGQGTGRHLVSAAEAVARARDVREVWLMTDTAEAFFKACGYAVCSRDDAPAIVRDTAQFQHLCPGSAVVMMKQLD